MTVKELREKLAGLPDDMPVMREYDTFFEEPGVSVASLGEGVGGWHVEGDFYHRDCKAPTYQRILVIANARWEP